MSKHLLLSFLLVSIAVFQCRADNKIHVYFNHPVDNSVSTGVNAVYVHNAIDDTLIAYINMAKYTIDIAQYDYIQGSFSSIADAINSAYARGVKVRWIYDGSSPNSGLNNLDSAIYTLGSPTSHAYGIMHNKFMIVDAHSADPSDAIVWTGSFDWSTEQFNTDYNNAIVIQDSALAHTYTDEFNMMWGDTGIAPNNATSKFGPYKTDLGRHNFVVDGVNIELYFSPSDNTNDHIGSTILTADKDLYFGMYTFTENDDATDIVNRYNAGVYVSGIDDSYSNGYSPYDLFTAHLGTHFIVYSGTGIYHSKMLIVDPSDPCSDPMVLTGSHNWTSSANTVNDENTLIIHNDTIANIYYQSFHQNFTDLGGSLDAIAGCTTAVPVVNNSNDLSVYPNPSADKFVINWQASATLQTNISVYNIVGQRVATLVNDNVTAGNHQYTFTPAANGVYMIHVNAGDKQYVQKLVKY